MQIIMRSKIIDANIEPILVVFSPSDLENVVEMHKNKRRFYMAFPETENQEFCRNLFEQWKTMFENYEQRCLRDRDLRL